MQFKCLLFISILVFLPVDSWADTYTANSCSLSDVTAAYNTASAGDVVAIPAGNCTWSSNLTIDKAITIQGAGTASTIITRESRNEIIDISLSSDDYVRITGIRFEKGGSNNAYGIIISGKKDNSFAYTKIRIDNNYFNGGSDQIEVNGWVYGVIDHNTFNNYNIGLRVIGDDHYSWGRPIAAGTANALFIEDNRYF